MTQHGLLGLTERNGPLVDLPSRSPYLRLHFGDQAAQLALRSRMPL
jgi:hypothetical protein